MSKNRKSGRQKMIVYKQTLNAAKHVNKHGEIKVKHASKNEKERVITGCMHHDLKKNGMPKSRVIVHQDGTCTCRLCHATFSYKSKTKKEMKDEVKPVRTEYSWQNGPRRHAELSIRRQSICISSH